MTDQSGGSEQDQRPELVRLDPYRRQRAGEQAQHRHPARPEPLLRTVLGAVIRRARKDQRRTLAEVAADAGISMPYLSEIERGRKEPSSEVLAAVGRALGLDLVELVARTYADLADSRPLEAEQPTVITIATPRHRLPGSRSRGTDAGDVIALAA